MAKRYTDREIWEKEWFLKLSNDEKAAWFYIKDKCDNAGVWTPNFTLANFILGEIDWNSLPEKLNGNVEILENGKWFLKDFCKFQYTNLNEDSTSIPIQSHIKLLKEHGLWARVSQGLPKVSQRLNKDFNKASQKLKDKDKDKDKEKDKDKDNYIDSDDVNKIYSAYPSRCVVSNRGTGKSQKNKDKIKALLKSHTAEELIKLIETYKNDCKDNKTYMKNFSTFLNNLPDIEEIEVIEMPKLEISNKDNKDNRWNMQNIF